MSEFQQVTVVKQANVYFDGKVSSRTVIFADGGKKTLGFMLPGDYEFGTEKAERMEVLGGSAKVWLPGANDARLYAAGEIFEVPANASFKLQIADYLDYCCSYLD